MTQSSEPNPFLGRTFNIGTASSDPESLQFLAALINMPPEMRQARLEIHAADAAAAREEAKAKADVEREEAKAKAVYDRWKDRWTFIIGTLLVSVISGSCLYLIFTLAVTDPIRTWATTVLSALITGLIGYLTGKAAK